MQNFLLALARLDNTINRQLGYVPAHDTIVALAELTRRAS